MSKKYFLLCTCLMLGTIVKAQDTVPKVQAAVSKTIIIDFASKPLPTLAVENIKPGEFYQIKIDNINQNLFKVSLTSADTVLSTPQQTPTFGKVDLDMFSKIITGIGPFATSVAQTQVADGALDIDRLAAYMEYMKYATPGDVKPIKKKEIEERMTKEDGNLSRAKLSIDQIVARIDSLKLEVYKLKLYALKVTNPATTFNFTQALQAVENVRDSISALTADLSTKKKSYEAFSSDDKNKEIIAKDSALAKADDLIKKAYDKSLTALSELQASVSADKTYELLSQLVFIENNASNTYTSLPIQLNGERSKVNLSITPRDEKYNLQSYYTQIVFPQNIKPYTVVGLSFYGSNLHDKAYSTIKTMINDSTASYSFKEEDLTKAEVGVAALLRFGTKFKNSDKFGIHGSIGAGVSLSNKIKPRVLFGGGFSYGKKHMFALDFGGILGYVDRLSSAIDLSQAYLEKPETITVSKLRVGVFASIGYVYQF